MMKFTFPVHTLSLGGAQRMLVEITNGLVAKGHEVIIIMPNYGKIDYPVRANINRLDKPSFDKDEFPYSDIIVSNFYDIVGPAQLASQSGKGVHVRLSLCYEPAFLPNNYKSLPSYHVTKHILVLSKWQQQLVKLIHGVDAHIVPIGVNSSFTDLGIRKSNITPKVSAILRDPDHGFTLHREQTYLIDVLRRVKNLYPFVQINLFCPPSEFYTSPSLQSLRDTSDEFRFLTPKDDIEMCYHYSETDIFVSASSYDAGSLPGLEAMRCGAALVSVYSGGNMDYCRPGKNCLMSFRYQGLLEEDIKRLIRNPGYRKKLANRGKKDSGLWTWDRSVKAFEEAIEQILANP